MNQYNHTVSRASSVHAFLDLAARQIGVSDLDLFIAYSFIGGTRRLVVPVVLQASKVKSRNEVTRIMGYNRAKCYAFIAVLSVRFYFLSTCVDPPDSIR